MEFPVRCFSCGKVIGHLWKRYKSMTKEGKTPKEAFEELGVERYCCRRMFISHVELMKEVIHYPRLSQ